MFGGTGLLAALLATGIPIISGAPSGSNGHAPKKLGDVLDVWTDKEQDSCAKYYNHAVELGKGGGKVLNDQWASIVI